MKEAYLVWVADMLHQIPGMNVDFILLLFGRLVLLDSSKENHQFLQNKHTKKES